MSRNAYILEAFKQFDSLTEEDDIITREELPIYDAGAEKMHDFLDTVGDDSDISIIDLEAEAEEDLKQSYVGKVILDCNVCHSNLFVNKDEVVVDEDGDANIDLECPYCMSNEGYTIIGQVEPYSEFEEEEVEVPEEDIEIEMTEDVDSSKEFQDKIDECGDMPVEESMKLDGVKGLKGRKSLWRRADKDGSQAIRGRNNSKISGTEDLREEYKYIDYDCILGDEEGKVYNERELRDIYNSFDDYIADEYDSFEDWFETLKHCGLPWIDESLKLDGAKNLKGTKKLWRRADKDGHKNLRGRANTNLSGTEDLRESIEDVSVTTGDETMTMTTKEDGGVIIETSPKVSEDFAEEEMFTEPEWSEDSNWEDGGEVVAPLSDTDEEEIELNSEVDTLDDEDVEALEEPDEFEIDDFDEESFDTLGESYLKEHYDNVAGFKTVNAKVFNNSLIIEGVIRFTSGSSKGTSFVFEATNRKNDNVLFEGFNKQISKGKKTFKLNCSVNEGCISPNKMSYNYMARNELNESVRVNGTVKTKK